jgi:hypothetical protein
MSFKSRVVTYIRDQTCDLVTSASSSATARTRPRQHCGCSLVPFTIMASKTAPSTPARAIRSQLMTRTSPAVPPPTQNYEPILKSVLRHRLTNNVLLYSAFFAWVVTSTWEIWEGRGTVSLVPISFSTLIKTGITWLSTAVPAVVLRKMLLSSKHSFGSFLK